MPLPAEQQQRFKRFLENAFEKLTADDYLVNALFTDIETFSELAFTEFPGKLEADITESYSYQLFYKTGAKYYANLESDFKKLAETVGLTFDAETNFHEKIIITDLPSIRILKQAGAIKESALEPFLETPALRFFSSVEKKEKTTYSTPLQQLVEDHDEVLKLEELSKKIKNELYYKKKQLAEKTKKLGIEPLALGFCEKPLVASEYEGLLEQFYMLRDLLQIAFHVKAHGHLDLLRPDQIKLTFYYAHEVSKDLQNASKFLYDLGAQVKIVHTTFGNYNVDLTKTQCEAAINALRPINKKQTLPI